MALVLGISVFAFPFEFVVYVEANVGFEGDYDEQEAREGGPADKMAVVAKVEVVVGDGTTLAEGKYKPPEHIDDLKRSDAIVDFLQSPFITDPINFAHHMQDIDRDPDEKVPNGRQDDKLFKEQIVKGEEQSLPHSQHVNTFILLGDGIVPFFSHFFVTDDKLNKNDKSHKTFKCPQQTNRR